MFLYPQSVEDANNSGMNLLDQSVIKKGMDYSNELDKLLPCGNTLVIHVCVYIYMCVYVYILLRDNECIREGGGHGSKMNR